MIGFALQDAHTAPVVPVLAAVTADVKPAGEPLLCISTGFGTRRRIFSGSLRALLGFIVRRPADAVQLLAAASFLAALAVAAHKVLQLLGFFLRDADTCAMEPVGAQVATDVKPGRKRQLLRQQPASVMSDVQEMVGAERTWTRRRAFCRYSTVWCPSCDLLR